VFQRFLCAECVRPTVARAFRGAPEFRYDGPGDIANLDGNIVFRRLCEFWGKPMAARKLVAAMLGGLALAACDPLPKPLYTEVTPPASFRTEADGVRVDNEGYKLDAVGYRINKRVDRIGVDDVQANTAGDKSNALAGNWISASG
jgi:hypothetical protein